MEKECLDVGIEGFPTWVIKGEVGHAKIIAIRPLQFLFLALFFKFQLILIEAFCHFLQKKSGELEFSELAESSGFTSDEVSQSTEVVQ